MRLIELEPGFRDHADGGLLSAAKAEREARSRRAVRVRPRRDRRLRRRHRRPPDALDEEHPRQHAGRADAPTSAAAAACAIIDIVATYLRHLRSCAEAAAGAPIDRAVLGRPVYLRRRRPRARRPGRSGAAQRGRDAPAFARSCSSTSRSPPPSTTSRRVTREEKVLVADIGGGTSDFSIVRVGPERSGEASIARTTSSPTTASTSPAPTSTAASSWRSILPLFGYGALRPEHRRRAGARGAERGLLRPRDLAPDQHRLQPAARRRAARHALVLRRPGAASAPDDGRQRATRPRAASRAPRAPRSRSPTAARSTIDLDHVEPGLGAELDEAEARARARRPTSTASSPRRATTVAQAGLAAGRRRRALFHRRLDRPRLLSERLRRRLPAARAGARRSLRQRRDRPGAVRAASLRRPRARALTAARAQSASTAAIACAGRLDVAACSARRRTCAPSAPGRPRTPRAAGRPGAATGRCS